MRRHFGGSARDRPPECQTQQHNGHFHPDRYPRPGESGNGHSVHSDVIVSNPPYIKEEEKKDMERNVLDYEPHLALFVPDNDPLLYYWHIAHFGKKKLRRNGHLYFEINAACGNMVVEMLEEEGYKNIELIQDLSGKDRIIKARK